MRRCTRKLGRKDTKREAARQETEDRVRENDKGEKSAEMATHKEQANKKNEKTDGTRRAGRCLAVDIGCEARPRRSRGRKADVHGEN